MVAGINLWAVRKQYTLEKEAHCKVETAGHETGDSCCLLCLDNCIRIRRNLEKRLLHCQLMPLTLAPYLASKAKVVTGRLYLIRVPSVEQGSRCNERNKPVLSHEPSTRNK